MNGKTPLIMELRITITYIKGSLDHIWFKINFSSFISVGIFPRPPCLLFIVKARSYMYLLWLLDTYLYYSLI
mgnify:CR=1 FL=1